MPTGPRRAKSIELRLLGFMGVLVILIAIAGLIQQALGRRELSNLRQRLEASGTLRSFDAIAPPAPPESIENGRTLLASLEPLTSLYKAHPALLERPFSLYEISPDAWASASTAATPPFHSKTTEHTPKSWADFRRQLAFASDLLESRRLLQKTVALKYEYETFVDREPLDRIPGLISLLQWDTVLRLHDGDTAGAIGNLSDVVRLVRFIGARHVLFHHRREIAEWRGTVETLFCAVLQANSLTDADLLRLSDIASSIDFFSDALTTMEIETASIRIFYSLMDQLPSNSVRWAFGGDPPWLFGTKWTISFRRSLWRALWADADQARMLSQWAAALDQMRQLIATRNWQAIGPTLPEVNTTPSAIEHLRFPIASRGYINSVMREHFLSTLQAETSRQQILTVIALERYRLKNSHYPATLADLVPAYLPEPPPDWFDGHPLKYHLKPNDHFLLYSVGENSHDDGGDPSRPEMAPTARDLVWPRLQ